MCGTIPRAFAGQERAVFVAAAAGADARAAVLLSATVLLLVGMEVVVVVTFQTTLTCNSCNVSKQSWCFTSTGKNGVRVGVWYL